MFDPETTAFLESGCALIVGTVAADGAPHAGRAWGLQVLSPDTDRAQIRLLLDAGDTFTVTHASERGPIAVTGSCVRTFRSLQLKGTSLGIGVVTADERARAVQYRHDFFAAISETDAIDLPTLRRLEPVDVVACVIEVHECFDQTPGPDAGARIETSRS